VAVDRGEAGSYRFAQQIWQIDKRRHLERGRRCVRGVMCAAFGCLGLGGVLLLLLLLLLRLGASSRRRQRCPWLAATSVPYT